MIENEKKWQSPVKDLQFFVPQQYVAACAPGETYVEYTFWCNAGSSGNNYGVWLETNGISGLQQDGPLADERLRNFHPCNESHSVTVRKGESVDNVFPYGYIRRLRWGSGQTTVDPTINVRVWTNNGTNVHCTDNLSMNDWTEKKPS